MIPNNLFLYIYIYIYIRISYLESCHILKEINKTIEIEEIEFDLYICTNLFCIKKITNIIRFLTE